MPEQTGTNIRPGREAGEHVLPPGGLTAVCLGYFMIILDTTIVNVALPALRSDLTAGVQGLQWVVDGYLLTFAALLLSGGALADRLGARRVFQLGLAVFVAASIACGAAPGIVTLVLARLAQGVGAAIAVPASLALLRAAYTDPARRARAIGMWGAVAGVAAATGPVLGGLLVSAVGWRLVFLVNVPIGLVAMLLTARHVPAPAPRPHGLDPAGQLTGFLALAALTFALIEGGNAGWTPPVVATAVLFVVALAAFLLIERAAVHPMLPLGLFRTATFTGGNGVGLLINLGFYAQLFVINLYFQQIRHYPALLAGLALLPESGVVAVASALSGRFTARYGGPRPTMLLGLIIGGTGLLGLMVAGAHTPYLLLPVPLALAGFGMAFTMPAVTTAAVDSVPAERAGLASGAINMARQVGSVLGIALLGSLVGGHQPVPGLRLALLLSGAVFLAAAVLTRATVAHRPGGG